MSLVREIGSSILLAEPLPAQRSNLGSSLRISRGAAARDDGERAGVSVLMSHIAGSSDSPAPRAVRVTPIG
jgi:hypothetical protein